MGREVLEGILETVEAKGDDLRIVGVRVQEERYSVQKKTCLYTNFSQHYVGQHVIIFTKDEDGMFEQTIANNKGSHTIVVPLDYITSIDKKYF